VIGVAVADEHSVNLTRLGVFQQPRHGRIAKIDDETEPVVLNQEAAAGLARFRPRTAPAQDREPHHHPP
jgi:hypothetical protein